jgi:uncharacterized protein YkwD
MPKPHHLRRFGRLLPLVVTGTALLGAAPAAASPVPACPPGQGARALTVTTLCLINQERASRGAPRLRLDGKLRRAARRHSRDMVARHYFSHTSRTGLSPSARIARTGWMNGRSHWKIGENLAWQMRAPSPRSIVDAWLRSRPHRRVLLDPAFHVIGLGIVRGVPFAGARRGATYAADFGS